MIPLGSKIKHIKRGSVYEVVGRTNNIHDLPHGEVFLPADDSEAMFVVIEAHDGVLWQGIAPYGFTVDPSNGQERLRLPLLVQKSGDTAFPDWIIYRQVDGAMVFARPENEFTPDRFEVL